MKETFKGKAKLRIHLSVRNKCVQLFTDILAMETRAGSQDLCKVSVLSSSVLGHTLLLVSCCQIRRRLVAGHLLAHGKWTQRCPYSV